MCNAMVERSLPGEPQGGLLTIWCIATYYTVGHNYQTPSDRSQNSVTMLLLSIDIPTTKHENDAYNVSKFTYLTYLLP